MEIKFKTTVTDEGKKIELVVDLSDIDELSSNIDKYGYELTENMRQYTGLNDKNSAEIYEGDKIVSNSYPFYGNAPEIIDSDGLCTELNYVGVVGRDLEGVYYDLVKVSDRVSGRACGGNITDLEEILLVTVDLGNGND